MVEDLSSEVKKNNKLVSQIKKDDNKINELISFVEKKQKWRYEKSLIVDKDKEINDELFENNFDLETLELHDQVTKISKNAFVNEKRVYYVC